LRHHPLHLLLLLLPPPLFHMRDTSVSLLLIFATKPFPSHLCYDPVQSWNLWLIRAMEQSFLERKNVAGLQKDKRLTEGGTKDRQTEGARRCTLKTVAPQSRRKSAGAGRERTRQRTS
jgi:hypothetical protein